MPLKPGDTVTLSISPTVQLAPYQYLKPTASLTRKLGDDVESSLEEMSADLRKLAARATLMELNVVNDLYDALGSGDQKSLEAYCMKEIGYVAQGQSESAPVGPKPKPSLKSGIGKGPVKKGG